MASYQAQTVSPAPTYVETTTSELVPGFRTLAQEYFELQTEMALALRGELRRVLSREKVLFAMADPE